MEVALGEGWSEVVDALGDIGRILQSYENAGRSSEAVPFLKSAYEILCLMMGDLIVDGIRPTVLEKWNKCWTLF